MLRPTVCCVSVLFVVSWMLGARGADPGGSSVPGDVNGDGVLDVADPIHLIQHLFAGGPGPVAPVAALAAEQEAILDLFTLTTVIDGSGVEYPTLRLTGVNLQIVNGLGATNGNPADSDALDSVVTETNGVGNLIVGYNELAPGYGTRSGSHNLVVGSQLAYHRFGGLLVGRRSEIEGAYASVSGGRGRARGDHSSVSGGDGVAIGTYSSVSGGLSGTARGVGAAVSGGDNNEAAGPQTSICGGEGNYASGYASSISGGNDNVTVAPLSSISAGESLETLEIHAWAACRYACP